LAVKTASEMTYTVSGGALNSTQSNQPVHIRYTTVKNFNVGPASSAHLGLCW